MKETYRPIPTELTRSLASPRLEREGILFMAEPGSGVIEQGKGTLVFEKPIVDTRKASLTAPAGIAPEWQVELGDDVINRDTARVARLATEMGIFPTKKSLERQTKPERTEVLKNAQLDDTARLEKAEQLLKEKGLLEKEASLSEKQKQAILDAHYLGMDEKREKMLWEGKNGGKAGVYNYKQEQLGEKVVKLIGEDKNNPLFTKEARRVLMENAIAALPTEIPPLTDARLQRVAEELEQIIAEEARRTGTTNPNLPRSVIENQLSRIRAMLDDPLEANRPKPVEGMDLMRLLRRWGVETIEAEERERERREGGGRRREGVLPEATDIENYIRGVRDNPASRNITREKEFIAAIKEKMKNPAIPPIGAYDFPSDLLTAAASFKETRDEFISSVIFKPYEDSTERNQYQIDLYAGDKLKKLLDAVRKDPTIDSDVREKEYRDLLGLETAAELFHTMNGRILAGSLDEFVRIAERIDPRHFELMNKITGVGQVMRLYEQKYSEHLAKYGVLYNYDAVKKDVEKTFIKMCEEGFVKSPYDTRKDENGKPGNLEKWEIDRALNVGRNFTNLTFRAAEYMALGEIRKVPFQKYKSVPQESAIKLLNAIQWVGERFEVGNGRGGPQFLQLVKERFNENNRDTGKKLGINKIKKFGGRHVEEMEYAEMFGISGVWSGWRLENMAFRNVLTGLPEGQPRTLREWFDDPTIKGKLGVVEKHLEHATHHGHKDASKADMRKAQDELVEIFEPLIESQHNGLGSLLAKWEVSGEKGYKVRTMIWERIAETNTPMMINYLQGLEMDGVNIQSLEALQQETGISGDAFEAFRQKVILRYERAVQQASGKDVSGITDIDLTPQEQLLEQRIKEEGRKLAPHLADVIFAYVPFMNDIQFEDFEYSDKEVDPTQEGPGQEFYKRRVASDFSEYNKGIYGYIAIQDFPAGFKVDDAAEALKKMEKGLSGPPGPKEGMARSVPVVMAVLDFYETEGPGLHMEERIEALKKSVEKKKAKIEKEFEKKYGKNLTKEQEEEKKRLLHKVEAEGDPKKREPRYGSWIRKQMLARIIAQATEHPTSAAEQYAGMGAESLDEGAMRAFCEKLYQLGVLTHAQMARIRRKKKFTAGWLLSAIFRDFFPFVVAAGISALATEASVEVLGKPSGGR